MSLSLRDVLCREDAQNAIIRMGADALHHLDQVGDRTKCLIGSTETASAKKSVACGAPVARALRVHGERATGASILDRVAGFFQSIASSPIDEITRSWCVLCIFFLFPKARIGVASATDVRFAPYFDGDQNTIAPFDTRISQKLCGTGRKQAMNPVEIVISEFQLYQILDTK